MLLTRFSAIALLVTSGLAYADGSEDFRLSGRIDAGVRHYLDDGLYQGQTAAGSTPFFGLSIEGSGSAGAGNVVFDFSGLYDEDTGRSYFNVAKFYYYQSFASSDFLFGFETENWSVVESRSVINVINPRNESGSLLGNDLLGTPMFAGNFYTDIGTFSAYALLGFLEPNSDDASSRFRAPILPDYGNPVFEEGEGRHLDLALRYTTNFNIGDGAADFSVSYFDGTSRTPVCTADGVNPSNCSAAIIAALGPIPGAPGPGASSDEFWAWMGANATDAMVASASATPVPNLRALYQHIRQIGTSFVYARNDLQLRFEGIYRESNGFDQVSAVVGGDYTFNDITPGGASLSVALEYLYDDRDPEMGFALFQNDVFLGLGYRFNNHLDTKLDFGVFHDLDSKANLYTLGVSSRLNDRLAVSLNATKVDVDGWNDPLAFAKEDTFLEFYLSYFF